MFINSQCWSWLKLEYGKQNLNGSKYRFLDNPRNMISLVLSTVCIICYLWQNMIHRSGLLVGPTCSTASKYHFLCHWNFHYRTAEDIPSIWFIWHEQLNLHTHCWKHPWALDKTKTNKQIHSETSKICPTPVRAS